MIIAVCGYGSVGTSAVIDFIKGYSFVQSVPFEFQIIHQADGISDLKYHLTISKDRVACNAAIIRFIKLMKYSVTGRRLKRLVGPKYYSIIDAYIEKIVQARWNGRSNYDPIDIGDRSRYSSIQFIQRAISYCIRKINPKANFPGYKERYYSILSEKEFDIATKDFLQLLLAEAGVNVSGYVILDTIFSATNPSQGREFFDDVKTIIVDRDPRDNYAEAQRLYYLNSFMPRGTTRNFVQYYRSSRDLSSRTCDMLKIQYEDLIYHYFETTERIMSYLGFADRPENEFQFFNPDISVQYTKRFTEIDQAIVKEIEENLPEYIYEFPEYTEIGGKK